MNSLSCLLVAALWISGGLDTPESGAPLLSRSFVLSVRPTNAVLTCVVDGWCEAEVNGRKVSDAVFSPVVCQPDKRVSVLSYDVSSLLNEGTNVVSFLLGNGWKNPFTIDTWGFYKAPWRGTPRVSATLVSEGMVLVETDGSWEAESSPIVFDALRNGEWYDARREGRRIDLRPATVEKYSPWGVVSPEDAVPCRAVETFDPVRTLPAPDGTMVYDFGVNIAGWCEIDVWGEAGSKVTLDYDESLTPSNTPLGYVSIFLKGHGDTRPVQHDEYTLAGKAGGETWHPRFAYHGFRYVRVAFDGKVELKSIRARFVHSDFKCAGTIETTDLVFSRLQNATIRSYLSNFVGIPTDCPHREKNGWTGDAQLSCETGLWNFQAKNGYVHFLRMMLDAQLPNGAVPCILPCSPSFGYGWGSGPAWDAALFVIPRQIYRFTGDDGPARESYAAMKRYLSFIGGKADKDGLVEYGLGDWCYGEKFTKPTPVRLTDSAWIYHFNRELAAWARRFNEPGIAEEADVRAETIRRAFNKVFWRGNGIYADGQWTALAAPLYFKGLCVDGEETNVVRRLVESVRQRKHRAHFGILGAKWVPRILAEYGHIDDAWMLFTQPEMPGWAYWLRSGYGSLMENWDMSNSRNHIMFGDLSAFAYECIAGIVPIEPGFRKVRFAPHAPKGVSSFEARHLTPCGEIRAGWSVGANGNREYFCDVPPGIEVIR